MDKETADVLGKLVDKLPGSSIKKAGDVTIAAFEKCLSPLANFLGGWGELIKLRYEAKAAHEKTMITEIYDRANQKVDTANIPPKEPINVNVHFAIIDYSPLESDPIKREFLANLLANEELYGGVHPEIVKILNAVTRKDLAVLLTISKGDFKDAKISMQDFPHDDVDEEKSLSGNNFTLSILERYGLIDRSSIPFENSSTVPFFMKGIRLTDIGKELIACIAEPQSRTIEGQRRS